MAAQEVSHIMNTFIFEPSVIFAINLFFKREFSTYFSSILIKVCAPKLKCSGIRNLVCQ